MNTITNITNIELTIGEGAVNFMFAVDGEQWTAALQLPSTSDSIHTVNGQDLDFDDDVQAEVFSALNNFYFESFGEDVDLAAASALLGERLETIQEVDGFYVAVTRDGRASLLRESPHREYYNKAALFAPVSRSDLQIGEDEFLDEQELIEKARGSRSAGHD